MAIFEHLLLSGVLSTRKGPFTFSHVVSPEFSHKMGMAARIIVNSHQMSQPAGVRYAEIERETADLRIQVVLDLEGGTRQDVSTGVPFFDRLLCLVARHGEIDLGIKVDGPYLTNGHLVVEEVGLTLGKAMREALANSDPIVQFADAATVKGDSCAHIALQFSSRGHLAYSHAFRREEIDGMALEDVRLFLEAFSSAGGISIHLLSCTGSNEFHMCEAIFIGLGRCVNLATRVWEKPNTNVSKGAR